MKTINKIISGCVLVASFAINSFGQAPMVSIEDGGKKPERLDKTALPVVVTETYIKDYPTASSESWYVYPSYAYTDGSDWYIYTPSEVSSNNPDYYVVEFVSDKTPSRAVYTKDGKRVVTYKESEKVPAAVTAALSKTVYKNWTVKKEKEECSRHTDAGTKKVYKVVVEKDKEKHALYFQEDGKLLKDKTIKS